MIREFQIQAFFHPTIPPGAQTASGCRFFDRSGLRSASIPSELAADYQWPESKSKKFGSNLVPKNRNSTKRMKETSGYVLHPS
jgi:hypothetical protein